MTLDCYMLNAPIVPILPLLLNVPIVPKPPTNFPIVPIVQDELFVHRWNFLQPLERKKHWGDSLGGLVALI